MRYADFSIRHKLMVIIVSTSALVLSLTAVAFVSYEWITYRDSLVTNTTTLARVIADNSTAALAFDSPGDAREILGALKAEKTIKSAVLYDEAGNVFATYPEGIEAPPLAQGSVSSFYFENQNLIVLETVIQSQKKYGTLYIRAGLDAIYENLRNYAEIVFLIFLLSLFASFVISTILQKRISDPVRSLAKTAQQVSEKGDFSVRAQKSGNDELGMLTQTFNEMLTRIQETDAGLRKAIGEKDVLIQEVHHRVKNNLQIILSLFDMQSRHIQSHDVQEVFRDCKSRIRSMTLVHEMLYGAMDLSKIDFEEYVKALVRDIGSSYRKELKVHSTIEMNQVELDIAKAVPLGLLINEVLTNSFKHAFHNTAEPEVFVKQIAGDRLKLIIGDNGSGLPQTDFSNPKRFGLRLIRLLSEQLHADLTVQGMNGTVYTIELPA